MSDLLKKIELDDIEIPGMPDITLSVFALLEDDNCSIKKIEDVIFKDQSLTTTILKIANAPIYQTGKSVNTLYDAIMSIGLHNLLAIVSIAALNNQLSNKNVDEHIFRHAMAVSGAATAFALQVKGVKKEEALVAGLLHDIGKTILCANAPEQYAEVKNTATKEGRSFADVENEKLGFNHCIVGSTLAKKWKLPRLYEFVIRNHHNNDFKDPLRPEHIVSYEDIMCYIVRVADTAAFAANKGFGVSSETKLPQILSALKIKKSAYDDVVNNLSATA